MSCKIKVLFISIALSFLFGQIANCNLYTSEEGRLSFGTIAEKISLSDCILELEETPFYNEDTSSPANVARSHRYLSKTKRFNSCSSPKGGFILTNKNNFPNLSHLSIESDQRFPSGLIEARRYLISLGKLII